MALLFSGICSVQPCYRSQDIWKKVAMEVTGKVEMEREAEKSSRRTQLFLRIATIWHLVLAILALVAILALWLIDSEFSTVVRLIGSFAFLLTAAISLFAARGIQRQQHRGRVASLALNYLWFIGCLAATFHYLGIFIGIDSLAENLARGLPFLGIVVAGYILRGFADRVGDDYSRARRVRRAGNIVMAAGFSHLLPGCRTHSRIDHGTRPYCRHRPPRIGHRHHTLWTDDVPDVASAYGQSDG